MDLNNLLHKMNDLHINVAEVIRNAEKLSDAAGDLANEIQKLVTTEAQADTIKINDPDG